VGFDRFLGLNRVLGIFLCEFPSSQHGVSTFLAQCINGIDTKMFNFDGKMKNIYGKTMESFLFNQAKAWKQQH
jgi:hypothetical protein